MNSRPPPPQSVPPSYAFVTRVYRRNLRPVVISTAFMAALWTLFSGIGSFRNFGVDRTQNVSKIANLSIALGASYMTISAVGWFGILSAVSQRLALVRMYAFLAAFASLLVVATSFARVVTHFVWKDDIIRECTQLTKDRTFVYYGFFGPSHHDSLNGAEAADWCQRAWDHDSWSEIIALLIILFLAALFTMIAFSYYRQLLDPTSPANASRAPSHQARMEGFPSHYNPPYNASIPTLPYGYNNNSGPYYAPPAGPPPGHDESFVPPYDNYGKPPGYTGDGKGFDDGKDSKDSFSEFDGQKPGEERDVTSRPGPGGREAFH